MKENPVIRLVCIVIIHVGEEACPRNIVYKGTDIKGNKSRKKKMIALETIISSTDTKAKGGKNL